MDQPSSLTALASSGSLSTSDLRHLYGLIRHLVVDVGMRVVDRIGRGRSQLVVADFAHVLIDKCLGAANESGFAGDLDRRRVASTRRVFIGLCRVRRRRTGQ